MMIWGEMMTQWNAAQRAGETSPASALAYILVAAIFDQLSIFGWMIGL